jgi:hypothetical protein
MRATLNAKAANTPRRAGWRGAWLLVYQCALLAALVALSLLGIAPADAHAHDEGNQATLSIQRPNSGPVGAHVVGAAKYFTSSHTFALGYILSGNNCLLNFTAIPDASTFTVKSDGTATFTFVWPATDTGTYFVCARDVANVTIPPVQSNNHFVVLGTTAPAIEVTSAPGDSGTPTPTSNDTYYPGSEVQVTGTNFLPGGTTVGVFYSGVQSELGTLLSSGINADTQGGFITTVKLPDFRTGVLYLHAATLDASNGLPPSLQADAQITVSLAPTATTTPSPTPSPTATVPPTTTTPPTTGNGGDGPRTAGIVGLSSLSVLLLGLGAYFLITGARARRLV